MTSHRGLGLFVVALSALAQEPSEVGRSPLPITVIGRTSIYLVAPEGKKPLATVEIGQPVDGVVYGPDGDRIYVFASALAGRGGGASRPAKLDLIGLNSRRIDGTLALGRNPTSALFTRDGGTLVVLNGEPGQASVTIVNARSLGVLGVVPVRSNPIGMVLSGDERHLFVAAAGAKRAPAPDSVPGLSVVELATRSLLATTPLGGAPRQIVLSGDRVYVLCETKKGATVNVFDGRNGEEIAAHAVPRTSFELVPNPTRPIVYLGAGSSVFVFENGRQLTTHQLDKPLVRLEVARDGSRVVAATSRSTFVLDDAGSKLRGTIAAGIESGCADCPLALSADARRTIIAWPMDANIKIFDNDALKVVSDSDEFGRKSMVMAAAVGATMAAVRAQAGSTGVAGWSLTFTPQLPAGSAEGWIAFRGDGRYAFAVNAATGDLCTFDLDTGARVAMVKLNGARKAMATSASGLVFGIGDGDLIAIDPKDGKERVNAWQQAITGAQRNADGTEVLVFKRERIDVLGSSDGRKLRSVLEVVEPHAVVFPPSAGDAP